MTKLAMPKIDRKLISKKKDVIIDLKKIVKAGNVLDHEDEIRPFETDALSAYKQKPLAVIFPENTKEVSKVLAYCNQQRIKVVPRGAGTGLSGGALPLADCILLCLSKFNKIINIDYKKDSLFGIERLNVPRSTIPAVTHVDYSARIQTVTKETNSIFYDLIRKLKDVNDCPVVINTSFNVRGEPIVCTPEDAFNCFMGTELDTLVIGNCFLKKNEQNGSLKKNYINKYEN